MQKQVHAYIAMLLCIALMLPVVAAARDRGYTVKYDGGSIPAVKSGSDLHLFIEPTLIRFMRGKQEVAVIPAQSVTEISYGQDVHRRVGTAVAVGAITFGLGALTALSKSKKHFVGLTWDNGKNKGGLAIQCDKSEYRGILAGLEGVTGKKAVDSAGMSVKN